jgi:hypothetical protein
MQSLILYLTLAAMGGAAIGIIGWQFRCEIGWALLKASLYPFRPILRPLARRYAIPWMEAQAEKERQELIKKLQSRSPEE